tara:strand:- start:195 stop:1637 length:1443 start_codon:yes stop_codon:yes gene_type:complete
MIKKVANDTFYLLTSSLFGRFFGAIIGLLTAKVLGPSDFGILKIINFLPKLSKFGSLGLADVVKREIPHLRSQNINPKLEKKIKDVGFSWHVVWSVILSFFIFFISFLYNDSIIKYGLWIVSLTLFFNSLNKICFVLLSIDKNFKAISYTNALIVLSSSVFILVTIYSFKIYSILFAGLFSSIIGFIFLLRLSKISKIRFSYNKNELFRQLKVGIWLSSGTIAFGVFSLTQRILILNFFNSEILGIYMLFIFIYEGLILLANNFLRAITIDLYEKLSNIDINKSVKNIILKCSLFIGLIFPILSGLIVLILPFFINIYFKEYNIINTSLFLLIPIITFETASLLIRTTMNSRKINMQIQFAILYFLSTLVFILFLYVFNFFSSELYIAILSRTFASISLFFGGFLLTRKYFFNSNYTFIKNILILLLPMFNVLFSILVISYFDYYNIIIKLFFYILLIFPITYIYSKKLKLRYVFNKIIN